MPTSRRHPPRPEPPTIPARPQNREYTLPLCGRFPARFRQLRRRLLDVEETSRLAFCAKNLPGSPLPSVVVRSAISCKVLRNGPKRKRE